MRRLTQEEFIRRAREVHGSRYDYSQAGYETMRKPVDVICCEHGLFKQIASDHVKGRGCPKCANEHNNDKVRVTTDKFIERALKIHGEKYDYAKVKCERVTNKVKIICPEHGEFSQRAYSHLEGYGCPKCAGQYMDTEYFIQRAKEIHGNLYDYSKVDYVNSHALIRIVCPQHGEFEQQPRVHLAGSGCPKCKFMSSVSEDNLYEKLLKKFGSADVKRQFGDRRYPYHCDFYIKSLDLFIEYNGFYTHGGKWFDPDDPKDIAKLEEWKKRNESDEYGEYSGTIYNWTVRDVLKRETAKKNNLNYVVLWNEKDVDEWFKCGCSARQDWM